MKLVFRDYGGESDEKVNGVNIHGEDVFKVINDNWRIVEIYREPDLDVYLIKIANINNQFGCI